MQFTFAERAYIWLDSFPLEGAFKRKLLRLAGDAATLAKNFENFKVLFCYSLFCLSTSIAMVVASIKACALFLKT